MGFLEPLKERLSFREDLAAYLETALFTVFAIAIGWYFSPEDPLLLQKPFSYFIFVVTIITLFYGFSAAVIILSVMALAMLFFYESFHYEIFSLYILLAFVLSEFHFYWHRKLKEHEEINDFLNDRLEENAVNLFVIKTSHDQLEKNYILKPMSIRETLKEIKDLVRKDPKNAFEEFSKLLSRVCGIESGAFYIKEGSIYKKVSNIGNSAVELVLHDPLVENAIENKNANYLAVSNVEHTRYTAVVPAVDTHGEIMGIFLVKEISFLNLNRDNMLTLALFLTYFINIYLNDKSFGDINKEYPEIPDFFIKELQRLSLLNQKFKTESSLVVFEFPFFAENELLSTKIERSLRGMDIMYAQCDDSRCKIVTLLPLTSLLGADSFVNRIDNLIAREFSGIKDSVTKKILLVKPQLSTTLQELTKQDAGDGI